MSDLKPLLASLSLAPLDIKLYEKALTHKSAVKPLSKNYNERLEFLGDRVLGLIVATWLFEEFQEDSEGDLAKRQAVLVSKDTLIKVAYDIQVPQYLCVSKALQKAALGRVESLYADAVEALLAAIYLDQGLLKAQEFVRYYWKPYFTQLQKAPKDPKSALQEWAQGRGLPIPYYEIITTIGPAHAPEFEIRLTVKGYERETVRSLSRRKGEYQAAENFLKRIIHQK